MKDLSGENRKDAIARERSREATRRYQQAHKTQIAAKSKAIRDARRAQGLPTRTYKYRAGVCAVCARTVGRLIGVRDTGERKGPIRIGAAAPKTFLCERCYDTKARRAKGVREKAPAWTPEKCREYAAQKAMKYHKRRRAKALEAYGGKCACCGEREPAFLAVDHIHGGGNAHRRSLSKSGKTAGGSKLYAWLERNGFPSGFQLLCHNCNFTKSHGGCPHEAQRRLACAS